MKKDWMARELTLEIVVGAFMIMIFLGLGYFTIILSREAWFEKQYEVNVLFDHVMGLREGDKVFVRGMTVGKIASLELKGDGVHVRGILDQPLELHEDYRIQIVTSSILGGRHMEISEGSDEAGAISSDTLLKGDRPYDIVTDAAELVNKVREGLVNGGVVENLQDTARNLKDISQRLHDGKGTLGKLLSEDDGLYQDVAATMKSIRNISERIQNGEGVIGKLLQDDGVYEELEKTIKEARAAIDDVRETTPIVTFTSIFFGAF